MRTPNDRPTPVDNTRPRAAALAAPIDTLQSPPRRRALFAGLLATAAAVMGASFLKSARASSEARVIPPYSPGAAPAAAAATTETTVLAGGCFWGVQGVYQHMKGVSSAVSGYAGGDKKTAVYEMIGTGTTGHAEAVQITYDPRQVSYADLLQVFFSVAHDPTQLNRQGPDTGTQYRSAIFPANEAQARIAKDYIEQLGRARIYPAAIVTKIEPARAFYPAEAYHQDFMTRNPRHPYIVVNDLPKVEDLKKLFPKAFRAAPVLVNAKAG